jgi:hypothetical protein
MYLCNAGAGQALKNRALPQKCITDNLLRRNANRVMHIKNFAKKELSNLFSLPILHTVK